MIQFDDHIFQMGWFNHQLVDFLQCWKETVTASEAEELIQQSPALEGQRSVSIFGHVLLGDVE